MRQSGAWIGRSYWVPADWPPMVEAGLPCCTVTPPIVFGCGVGKADGGAVGEPAQSVGSTDDDVRMPALTEALLVREP